MADVHMLLQGAQPGILNSVEEIPLAADLHRTLLGDRPLYEAVDALCGTAIGVELDQLVIKSCLEFFGEGQSVWGMPGRERGLFNAWRELARRNARLFMRGLDVKHILAAAECPEGVIAHVMQQLGVVEQHWVGCFTRELARLHGWAGFIRWRSSAREYHWAQHRPADQVDFLALRLTLALALFREHGRRGMPDTAAGIGELVDGRTREAYLRRELYDGHVLPAFALRIEQVLSVGDDARIAETFDRYLLHKRATLATRQVDRLRLLAQRLGDEEVLMWLDAGGWICCCGPCARSSNARA